MGIILDFHTANYPSLEVNTPNRFVTDVENMSDPFVVMELSLVPRAMGLPIKSLVRVSGELILNYYIREGQGVSKQLQYTDSLMSFIGLSTINKITFMEVTPYVNSGIPGFAGTMNSVEFYMEHTNL
jgi:hypothetical protein